MTQCCQIKGLYRPIIEMSSRCMYLFSSLFFFPPHLFCRVFLCLVLWLERIRSLRALVFHTGCTISTRGTRIKPLQHAGVSPCFSFPQGTRSGPARPPLRRGPEVWGSSAASLHLPSRPGPGPARRGHDARGAPGGWGCAARWRPRPSGGEGERRGGAAGGASCQGPLPARCRGSAEGRPVAAASGRGAGLLRAELLVCCRRDGLGSASPEELRDRGRPGRGEGGRAALVRVPGGLELTMPGVWGGTLIRKVSGARRSSALQGGAGASLLEGRKGDSFCFRYLNNL